MHTRKAVSIYNDELLVIRLSGIFNTSAICNLITEIAAVESGRQYTKQLVYVDAITSVAITSEDVLFFRSRRPDRRQRAQSAFCVFNDLQYGIARMFQSFLESEMHGIEIFRDLPSSAAWLQIDEKAFMAWHDRDADIV